MLSGVGSLHDSMIAFEFVAFLECYHAIRCWRIHGAVVAEHWHAKVTARMRLSYNGVLHEMSMEM